MADCGAPGAAPVGAGAEGGTPITPAYLLQLRAAAREEGRRGFREGGGYEHLAGYVAAACLPVERDAGAAPWRQDGLPPCTPVFQSPSQLNVAEACMNAEVLFTLVFCADDAGRDELLRRRGFLDAVLYIFRAAAASAGVRDAPDALECATLAVRLLAARRYAVRVALLRHGLLDALSGALLGHHGRLPPASVVHLLSLLAVLADRCPPLQAAPATTQLLPHVARAAADPAVRGAALAALAAAAWGCPAAAGVVAASGALGAILADATAHVDRGCCTDAFRCFYACAAAYPPAAQAVRLAPAARRLLPRRLAEAARHYAAADARHAPPPGACVQALGGEEEGCAGAVGVWGSGGEAALRLKVEVTLDADGEDRDAPPVLSVAAGGGGVTLHAPGVGEVHPSPPCPDADGTVAFTLPAAALPAAAAAAPWDARPVALILTVAPCLHAAERPAHAAVAVCLDRFNAYAPGGGVILVGAGPAAAPPEDTASSRTCSLSTAPSLLEQRIKALEHHLDGRREQRRAASASGGRAAPERDEPGAPPRGRAAAGPAG
eukprot:TRINITY_DN30575_c0_g1_i1.p1 TRINITY_DN30575_c0_g1~~TRINITY_DN30575_c0_g1_i1.p1  ORF type:complete len:550 (+),score=160.84 TRINITY_DN30575_c0_g1_i1:47-1696(+)